MLGDYGFVLNLFCFVLSLYSFLSSVVAAKIRSQNLFLSSKRALFSITILASLATLLLLYSLISTDYSLSYVYKNVSNDLPFFYRVTAFWASLEGSHYLWTLLLTLFSSITLKTYAKDNEHIMPFVCMALSAILGWMFYLTITHSDPFAIKFPAELNGRGLNELLQNPYMAIHPPMLFTGYTTLAIPFAYSIAALCYGEITAGWLRTVRQWALIAFCFLTVGIFLGGRWAYVELGWAGYWAWDPVENSSFLPWLLTTALLHALIVQEKLGALKRVSIVLAFLAFFFSFFGTFITRSGIINSVHSFAQSPIGPNYMVYVSLLLVLFVILYLFKSPSILPARLNKAWGLSKETFLVLSQFLLCSFAIIIVIGTLYPIFSEWTTGVRLDVQAPYFNSFAPYIGFSLITLIAIGNLLAYHKGKLRGGLKLQAIAVGLSFLSSAIFAYFGDIFLSQGINLILQLLGVFLVFWCSFCLLGDFWLRFSTIKKFPFFIRKNFSYVGGLVSHIGICCAILGFLGNYRGLEKTATLTPGQSIAFYGYTLRYERFEVRKQDNARLIGANLSITDLNNQTYSMFPARAEYPTKPELFHEIDVLSHFWHDLYISLADLNKDDNSKVTLEIHINPTVRLVWFAGLLIALGGLVALLDRLRGVNSRDVLF